MPNNDALHNMISSRLDSFEESLRVFNDSFSRIERMDVSIDEIKGDVSEIKNEMKRMNGTIAKHTDQIHNVDLVRELMVRDINELREQQKREKESQIVTSNRQFEIWSKLGWITLGIIGSIVYAVLKKTGVINF